MRNSCLFGNAVSWIRDLLRPIELHVRRWRAGDAWPAELLEMCRGLAVPNSGKAGVSLSSCLNQSQGRIRREGSCKRQAFWLLQEQLPATPLQSKNRAPILCLGRA